MAKHLSPDERIPRAEVVKDHACTLCGFKTNSQHNLDCHVKRKHADTASHLCNNCGQTFKIKYDLNFHLKKFHDDSGKYACNFCGPPPYVADLKLYTDPELALHVKKAHNMSTGEVLDCPSCNFVCKAGDSARMVEHFRHQHIRYKQFGCGICGKRFSKTSNVKYHILRSHDGLGNMDGKLKTQVAENYFDNRPDDLVDFRDLDPNSFPSRVDVLKAMETVKSQNIMSTFTAYETEH